MKIFNQPNTSGDWKCPVCKTNDNLPITLIPIHGTQNGNIIQAEQFHINCLDLTYFKNEFAIGMKFRG